MKLFDPSHTVALTPGQIRVRDDLNERIRAGEILLESVPCLCGAKPEAMERLSQCDRFGLDQPIVICRSCGLIQSNPRMSESDYRWFYSADCYRLLYDGDDYLERFRKMLTAEQGQRMLWAIQRTGKRIRSVIEIGAGAGWNLIAFQHAGAEVAGWDYSKNLTALGRSHGIPLRQGSIREALAEGVRYDAIILNHVLEHFLDPLSQLHELHGLLNPGGLLYVGVPATDYPSLGLLQNAHTYYFTNRTLTHYLAKSLWIVSDIVHEYHFGMHTVAHPGHAPPVSLATEYRDSLARLQSNRWRVAVLERWYRVRAVVSAVMMRLGIYSAVRTVYRRLTAR